MKVYSIHEADKSLDLAIKLTAVRASRYRMFGSPDRIPEKEIAVADLRDGDRPDDFAQRFAVLDRHPMLEVLLVRCLP
jgi:hypothetical protein